MILLTLVCNIFYTLLLFITATNTFDESNLMQE